MYWSEECPADLLGDEDVPWETLSFFTSQAELQLRQSVLFSSLIGPEAWVSNLRYSLSGEILDVARHHQSDKLSPFHLICLELLHIIRGCALPVIRDITEVPRCCD